MTDEPNLFGKIKDKLIGKKQEWAAQGRLLTGTVAPHDQRLPPGQRLVKDWPVLDLGIQPSIPTTSYTLTIDGAVKYPITLSWADLMALPQTDSVSDMHCVTQWSNYDNHWRGIAASTILALVQPKPSCRTSSSTAMMIIPPMSGWSSSTSRIACSCINGMASRSRASMAARYAA